MNEPIRLMIVEDDTRYRKSLETFFSYAPGFSLLGAFPDVPDLLAALENSSPERPEPHIILMDLELPRLSGIEGTRRARALVPEVAVVILTVFEEPSTVLESICAGARGYLLKRTPANELVAQLRHIMDGGAPLTPGVARVVLDLLRVQQPAPAQAPAQPARLELSDREQEVLRELVKGRTYKQAATELGVSLDTVRTHVRHIYRKLQVHSVAEAVARAIRDRLV